MEAKDILLNDNNEVRIEAGDFVVGLCEGQNAKLLLRSNAGDWRNDPLMGIGIRRIVNVKLSGSMALTLRREVIGQFTADGSRVIDLSITTTTFKLTSERI